MLETLGGRFPINRHRLTCAIFSMAAFVVVPAQLSAMTPQPAVMIHEKALLNEFIQFLSVPNVATNQSDIERNADALTAMLRKRGLHVQRLSAGPGLPPLIYGELKAPKAKRTVLFYAHYDGQPVAQDGWTSNPWKPVIRLDGMPLDLRTLTSPINPEARIYARSASDDKGSIMAMLGALDAMQASGKRPSVNVKVIYEGEEEQGSKYLTRILEPNRDLLKSDLIIFGDGPVHQSRRMQIFYGARGASSVELTVFGPTRALHDGHYGNWAPNPAVMLAHLIAQMRDDDGHILIPGFYEDVAPISATDKAALASLPDVETALKSELGIARTEISPRVFDSTSLPSLNVRGLRAGQVGADAANAIPTQADASIDFRLVPNQTPDAIRAKVEGFLRQKGWFVTGEVPGPAVRSANPRIVMLKWQPGYAAAKTPLDAPSSKAVAAAVSAATGDPPILLPMLGGSVPMRLFADALNTLVVGVPIANHDNNQHGANENLRLRNLWDGIRIYEKLLTSLHW